MRIRGAGYEWLQKKNVTEVLLCNIHNAKKKNSVGIVKADIYSVN